AEVDDELKALATREAYVAAYEKLVQKAISERSGGEGDGRTAGLAEALKFVRDGRSAALGVRRAAERRREDLAASLAVASAEVERLRKPEERSVRSAEVTLEAADPGPARLRLSYVIPQAGWSPRYDARFDAAAGDLAVTYFGEVRQRTGEDWKDARLVLSTARPSVGASRPELVPLRLAAVAAEVRGRKIEHREEAAGRARAAIEAEAAAPEAAPEPAAAEPAPEEGLVATGSREVATSAVFAVPGRASIPSDGRPHKVPVASFRERAATSLETAPRLERFVYLKCSARNASPHPMLAGPVDIYRGSGFMGTSRLKFVAPGRPFEISLGIEESLKVRRAVTADAWSEDRREHRQGFDVEVESFGEAPATVTVIENHPVSEIEEVTVRLDSSTTPPAERDDKSGILRWRLPLVPGESKRVHLEYTVRYPAGRTASASK
ncbi:MAG: mucoidy inhibitor MuiA family protein, partial [Planctomycetes bacterium]|nr:mucoidy inhibitor MuiA family protein [Planctomycetota bacterium]